MPAKSKAQLRFMEAVAHGWHPSGNKHGPTPSQAMEYVHATKNKKDLPARSPGSKKKGK